MERRGSDSNYRYDFWVLIRPAEDVPGQWVGHCLNLDVVSQGDSPRQARDRVREAVASILTHDLVSGQNPLSRFNASLELWEELRFVMTRGAPAAFSEVETYGGVFAVMMGFEVSGRQARELEPPELLPTWFLPPGDSQQLPQP